MINGVWFKEHSTGNHGFLLILLGFLADFSYQFWDDEEIRLEFSRCDSNQEVV